jgi:hypothetical protein
MTRLYAGPPRVWIPWGKSFFSSPKCLVWLWGPPNLLVNGYQVSPLAVRWPGHEFNLSPPSAVEVKNEWSCTSAPPICLHSVNGKFYLLSRPLFFWYGIFCVTLFMMCVTSVFNFSVFTLIKSYLTLVPAIVDGKGIWWNALSGQK